MSEEFNIDENLLNEHSNSKVSIDKKYNFDFQSKSNPLSNKGKIKKEEFQSFRDNLSIMLLRKKVRTLDIKLHQHYLIKFIQSRLIDDFFCKKSEFISKIIDLKDISEI